MDAALGKNRIDKISAPRLDPNRDRALQSLKLLRVWTPFGW